MALGVGLFGFTEALRLYGPQVLLGERGVIELTQLGFLVAALCQLGRSSSRQSLRAAVVPLMLLIGAVLVRELDGALDLIVHGFWKYPAWALALAALAFSARNREAVVNSIDQMRQRRTVGLFVGAAFIVFIQSRILGRQVVWSGALGSGYLVVVPRLVEELTELAGYGLLLVACLDVTTVLEQASSER